MKSLKIIFILFILLPFLYSTEAQQIQAPMIVKKEVKKITDPQEIKTFLSKTKTENKISLLADKKFSSELIRMANNDSRINTRDKIITNKAKQASAGKLLQLIMPSNSISGLQPQSFSTDTTFITNGYKYEYNYDDAGNTIFKVYAKNFGENPTKTYDWGVIYHSVISPDKKEKILQNITVPMYNEFHCYTYDDGVITDHWWQIRQNYRIKNNYNNNGTINNTKLYYWYPCSDDSKEQNTISFTYKDNRVTEIAEKDYYGKTINRVDIGYYANTGFMSYAAYYGWDPVVEYMIPGYRDEWTYKAGAPTQDFWTTQIHYYAFNPSGNPLPNAYLWFNSWKEVVTYNPYWQPLKKQHYVWQPKLSIWTGTWGEEFGYEIDGHPASFTNGHHRVNNASVPLLSYRIKTARDTALVLTPSDTLTVPFKNFKKEENKYDTYGNLLLNTQSNWNDSDWKLSSKTENIFDYGTNADGILYPSKMTYQHKLLNSKFYNGKNELIDNLTYVYSNDFLTVDANEQVLTDSAGTFAVDTVRSNVIWTYSGGSDWLTITPVMTQISDTTLIHLSDKQLIGNAAIRFKATINNTHQARNCTVTLTPIYGTPKQITVIQYTPTGVDENKAAPYKLAPNPASDFFSIEGLEKKVKMTMTDISGKTVMEKLIYPNEKIDIKSLVKGVYIIKVNTITNKLIVK